MQNYLITGATGFVGANIARRLVSQGKSVHIISRNKDLNWRLKDIADKITVHEMDLLSHDLVKIIKKIEPEYIFHLAAFGSLPREDDIQKLIEINLKGTINLINAARESNFKLFINTGSSSEYGIKENPMCESDIVSPVNDYGVTKAAATLYAQKEGIRNNVPIITFRLFSVFGPYEERTRLIPYVILSAIQNEDINVGSPDNVRDFIFIEDLVDAYLKACEVNIRPGEIFNIGTGVQHKTKDVIEEVIKLSNTSSKVNFRVVEKQERQIEPKSWVADTKKTEKILRWKAKYSFGEGLRESIEWFEKNRKLYE